MSLWLCPWRDRSEDKFGERVFYSGRTHGEGRFGDRGVATVTMPREGQIWGQILGQRDCFSRALAASPPPPGTGAGPGSGRGRAAMATVASQCHLVASATRRGSPGWYREGEGRLSGAPSPGWVPAPSTHSQDRAGAERGRAWGHPPVPVPTVGDSAPRWPVWAGAIHCPIQAMSCTQVSCQEPG